MSIEVRLANGKGIALIDDDDAVRMPLDGWYLHGCGYAAHSPIAMSDGTTTTLLHRLIMRPPRGVFVDHINRHKLDCRRINLRLATKSQNGQNRSGAQPNNSLGIRGVSWQRKPSGTVVFFARVQVNGKQIYRCGFRSVKEAELAAKDLRRLHFTHSEECL